MKAITRVEKFQKLREEISRMPDENDFSTEQKSSGYAIAQAKKVQESDAKSAPPTSKIRGATFLKTDIPMSVFLLLLE